jgi:hypothetical protein
LAEGEPVFFELNFSYNLFSAPTERKAINLNVVVRNFRVEYSNDLIRTVAETIFAYRRLSDLGNVAIAPSSSIFDRKIKLWTPWYLVKQAYYLPDFQPHGLSRVTGVTNKEILEENKYVQQENEMRKMKGTQRALAGLDKSLRPIDMKIKVLIEGLFLSLNSDLDNKRYRNNRNLLQIKTDPFEIIVIKHAEKFGLSVLGVQIMTQSSFELLFQFSQQIQKALSIYLDHPAYKDGKKFYEGIVHKRVHESNKRLNPDTSLARFDGSTIRQTGVNFTMSEAPRFSTFGSSFKTRPTGSMSARGNRKLKGSTPPRNQPTLDFNAIKAIPRKQPNIIQKRDKFATSGPRTNPESFGKRFDEFDKDVEDESFNDTDEEIVALKAEIKGSPKKKTVQTKAKVKVNKERILEPSNRQIEIERDRISPPRQEIVENIPIQPRTGPSRLHKFKGTSLQNQVFFTNLLFSDLMNLHSKR